MLTLKVTDKSWFVEAVVAALIGLFLLVAGIVLLTARRLRHHGAVTVPPVPPVPPVPADSAAPGGTSDPDRAVGAGDGTEPTVPLGTTVRSPRLEADSPDTDVPHPDVADADGIDRSHADGTDADGAEAHRTDADGTDVDGIPGTDAPEHTDPTDPHDPQEVTR
jgi:hypothetical protein